LRESLVLVASVVLNIPNGVPHCDDSCRVFGRNLKPELFLERSKDLGYVAPGGFSARLVFGPHLTSFSQHAGDCETGYALEVTEVARHQGQSVLNRGGCNLQVQVFQTLATELELGLDLAEDPSCLQIEGQDRDRREESFLEVAKVARDSLGTKHPFVQLAGAGRGRTTSERALVSKRKPTSNSVEIQGPSSASAGRTTQNACQLVGPLPASGDTRQTGGGIRRSERSQL
jgi:hypothetical protein